MRSYGDFRSALQAAEWSDPTSVDSRGLGNSSSWPALIIGQFKMRRIGLPLCYPVSEASRLATN